MCIYLWMSDYCWKHPFSFNLFYIQGVTSLLILSERWGRRRQRKDPFSNYAVFPETLGVPSPHPQGACSLSFNDSHCTPYWVCFWWKCVHAIAPNTYIQGGVKVTDYRSGPLSRVWKKLLNILFKTMALFCPIYRITSVGSIFQNKSNYFF